MSKVVRPTDKYHWVRLTNFLCLAARDDTAYDGFLIVTFFTPRECWEPQR